MMNIWPRRKEKIDFGPMMSKFLDRRETEFEFAFQKEETAIPENASTA
jgi:hypothetical protein